jgi:lipoyl(octanoyl) transferase
MKLFDLGLVDYQKGYDAQREIFLSVKEGKFNSALLLCRHNPVITLGRAADKQNILAEEAVLRQKNIKVYEIDRGGDVTYHGPGQLIVYPIFNLQFFVKDIHKFLRMLENAVLGFLGDFGVKAKTHTGKTGVWIGDKKIASIGISIRNWITFHGISINIKQDDLANFRLIRPCGLDVEMTSLETVLGKRINLEDIKEAVEWEKLFYQN